MYGFPQSSRIAPLALKIGVIFKPLLENQLYERRDRTAVVPGCADQRFLDVAFDAETERVGLGHDEPRDAPAPYGAACPPCGKRIRSLAGYRLAGRN